MAEQMSFDEYYFEYCEGLSSEARRLMQMSWNAALGRGDHHFFVDELAEALGHEIGHGRSWNELLAEVEALTQEDMK